MGRVRTKTVKRASRVMIEKYYPRLTLDFHTNKRIADEVAIIPSKRLRNKIAGFTTHLMKRIQKGPVRGISFKLQEEERERKDNYVPEVSALAAPELGVEVDADTKDLLRSLNFDSIPTQVVSIVQAAPEALWVDFLPCGQRMEPRLLVQNEYLSDLLCSDSKGPESRTRRMPDLSSIPRLSGKTSYEYFKTNHLIASVPCIFDSDLVSNWKAFSPSVLNEPINSSFFDSLAVDTKVPVQTREVGADGNVEFCSEEMLLSEVLSLWRDGKGEGMYIKDWHLAASTIDNNINSFTASTPPFYSTPTVFKDDWLNGYHLSQPHLSDYRFVYIGPTGTRTPLHHDVFGSYSWSTNVAGCKKWRFFPPSSTKRLRVFPEESRSALRAWEEVEKDEYGGLVVDQAEGETVFVPSGWWHQVENTTPKSSSSSSPKVQLTVSINHNWFNSHSLRTIFIHLCNTYTDVIRSIEDIIPLLKQSSPESWAREFDEEVEKLVKMDAGWGWREFWGAVDWGMSHHLHQMAHEIGGGEEWYLPEWKWTKQEVQWCTDEFKKLDRAMKFEEFNEVLRKLELNQTQAKAETEVQSRTSCDASCG